MFLPTPKSVRLITKSAGKTDLRTRAGIVDDFAALEGERDRLGLAVQREIAGHFEAAVDRLDAAALEGDRGILLGVEKVRAPQVVISCLGCSCPRSAT